MKKGRKKKGLGAYLKTLLGLTVSLVALWWLFRSVERSAVLKMLREVNSYYLLLAFLTTCISYLLRSVRWPYFFSDNRLSFFNSYRCLIVGFFMNNVLPARLGEFVRAHLGGRASKQSRSYVLATVAAERLADGVTISVLFALLFSLFSPAGSHNDESALFYVAYLFLLAAVLTCLLIIFRRRAFYLLEKLSQRLPDRFSAYTVKRIRFFIEGLAPLLALRRLRYLFPLSVIIWLVELLVYYQVALAYGQPLSLAGLSLFLTAVNFSSLIPAAPAGIGVIEVFATIALVHIGVSRESALAMVATQHLIQIVAVGVPGALFFFVSMHGKLPEEEATESNADEANKLCSCRPTVQTTE